MDMQEYLDMTLAKSRKDTLANSPQLTLDDMVAEGNAHIKDGRVYQGRAEDAGFTAVELLVIFVVLGVLFSLGYVGIHFMSKFW